MQADTCGSGGEPAENAAPDRLAAVAAIPIAEAIVASVLDRPVRRVGPLVGMGSVNLIMFAEAGNEEFILRLNKPEDDPVHVQQTYEKERWCIERAADAGVPGPEVLAIGRQAGRAFMLQRRIHGTNGKQSRLEPTELMRILGRYARLIHEIPVSGFGDTVAGFESDIGRRGWLRFVDYNLGELTDSDPLLKLGVYSRTQKRTIADAFRRLRDLPLSVGLNHCDLARRNTILDAEGSVHLLDWGCAEISAVPHLDVYSLLGWYASDNPRLIAFLEGYGMSLREWELFLPEMYAFALLKSFDLTRWALDRCPSRVNEVARHAARRLYLFEAG